MKKHSVVLVMIAMLAALCIPAAFAQATGTVKGVAKDMQGNPIAGATVEWYNTDNGRKYTLKTNKKGEYFSLGIEPGKYKVTLLQDGKQLDSVNGYGVKVDENTLDFDEKQSQTEAAKQKGINQEQLKQMQEVHTSAGFRFCHQHSEPGHAGGCLARSALGAARRCLRRFSSEADRPG